MVASATVLSLPSHSLMGREPQPSPPVSVAKHYASRAASTFFRFGATIANEWNSSVASHFSTTRSGHESLRCRLIIPVASASFYCDNKDPLLYDLNKNN
jgi:hypothetical protein